MTANIEKDKPRDVDKWGNCSMCGGTHYGGGYACVYRCAVCVVNTLPVECKFENCPNSAKLKGPQP